MQLDGTKLTAGTTISLQLEPQKKSKGVRVVPDWSSGAMPFFLGYRDTSGECGEGLRSHLPK